MRLGITVRNMGASQLNYFLLKNANAFLAKHPGSDVIGFFEAQGRHAMPANFALMPLHEAWGYTGVVVATTFAAAGKLASFPGPSKRLFYVWDLEWCRPAERRAYEEWASVYCDPRLPLLARSGEHAKAIEDAWGRPVLGVVEDLNFDALLEAVERCP